MAFQHRAAEAMKIFAESAWSGVVSPEGVRFIDAMSVDALRISNLVAEGSGADLLETVVMIGGANYRRPDEQDMIDLSVQVMTPTVSLEEDESAGDTGNADQIARHKRVIGWVQESFMHRSSVSVARDWIADEATHGHGITDFWLQGWDRTRAAPEEGEGLSGAWWLYRGQWELWGK